MSEHRQGEVTPELDKLSCELLGEAFDRLAEGETFGVLLVVEDAERNATPYEFSADGADACLAAAYEQVTELAEAVQRYAIAYEGSVDAEGTGAYSDAVILEFEERDWPKYSAYSLVEGIGTGEDFGWTDPLPAGELPKLLG